MPDSMPAQENTMADKSKGNSRDKKEQDETGKTRSDALKDLPLRDGKAENVKGGRDDSTGTATGKRGHGGITLP